MRKCMGLHRGKRIDNGEWVYWDVFGRFTKSTGKISKVTIKRAAGESYYYHVHQLFDIINKDTIGECIGARDKNGRLIFEGDIVDASSEEWDCAGPAGHNSPILPFKWDTGVLGFAPFAIYDCACGVYINEKNTVIIGNIYDNPELLKEKTK